MRPIDADTLIQDIKNDPVIDCDMAKYLVDKVDGMETAYDVDKVVEQLEGIMKDDNIRFADQIVRRAINIVKGGLEE